MNRIGFRQTKGSYALLTETLRNEWGFQGFVITDYDQGNGPNDDIAVNRMVRAGTDQHMIDNTMSPGKYTETDNATGVTALRKAVKNTLFTMANSAQVNGAAPGAEVYYSMSPWRIAVIAVDIVIGLGTLWGIITIVLRAKDEKRNPQRYKKSKKNVKGEKV